MEIYDFFTASGINNTFSGYGPHPFFCDYCPQLSDLPDGKVYSSATCFEDNEPFQTIKIWPGWQGGSGKVKICLWNGLKGFRSLQELLNGSRTPYMNSITMNSIKGSWGGTIQGPFLRAYSLQLPHRCTGRPVCCREPQIGNDEACTLPPSSSWLSLSMPFATGWLILCLVVCLETLATHY